MAHHGAPIKLLGRAVRYRRLIAENFPWAPMPALFEALKATMEIDLAAGRPFCAALVTSPKRGYCPGPGFFTEAARLGAYDGPFEGPEAARYAKEESRLVIALYSGKTVS